MIYACIYVFLFTLPVVLWYSDSHAVVHCVKDEVHLFVFLWIGWIRNFLYKDRWNINWWRNVLGFRLIVNKSKGWSNELFWLRV